MSELVLQVDLRCHWFPKIFRFKGLRCFLFRRLDPGKHEHRLHEDKETTEFCVLCVFVFSFFEMELVVGDRLKMPSPPHRSGPKAIAAAAGRACGGGFGSSVAVGRSQQALVRCEL